MDDGTRIGDQGPEGFMELDETECRVGFLPAGLVLNVEGSLGDAVAHILEATCVVTGWDGEPATGEYSFHVSFPNEYPRYASGAQVRTGGSWAELVASRDIPVKDNLMERAREAALEARIGGMEGLKMGLDAYDEGDKLVLWLTAHGRMADLPNIDDMENILRRVEGEVLAAL